MPGDDDVGSQIKEVESHSRSEQPTPSLGAAVAVDDNSDVSQGTPSAHEWPPRGKGCHKRMSCLLQ